MIFISFIFCLQRLVEAQTQWTDTATGKVYDWTGLQKDSNNFYSIIDYTNPFTPSTYNFNFGSELPDTCSGQEVTASETIVFADGWMASCSILGRKSMQKVSAIADGIRITFNGGDVCFDNNQLTNRRIYFELTCSDKEGDWAIKESAYNNYCVVGMSKKTSFGCNVQTSKTWLWVALAVLVVLAGLNLAWNHVKKNEEGFNLPFKETISGFFDSVKEAGEKVSGKVKGLGSSASSNTKNYEMV